MSTQERGERFELVTSALLDMILDTVILIVKLSTNFGVHN
jgi:hypothetical protein